MSGSRAKAVRVYMSEHWVLGPEHYVNGKLAKWGRIVRWAKRSWTRRREMPA